MEALMNYVPVPKLMDALASKRKITAIFGGNKSTKTTFSVWKALFIYVGVIPHSARGIYPHQIPTHRPRHVRIIVQDYSKHWPETIKPLLLGDPESEFPGFLPKGWDNYDAESHMFTGPDGSYLSIMSCPPDQTGFPHQLRGPLIDHTLADELTREQVYTESLTRGVTLTDGPNTIDLSYCPQEGYDWTYDTFYKACYDPQTKERLPLEKQHQDIYSIKVSMRDNPSISPEMIETMKRSMKEWEVGFRVNGEYTNRTNSPFFDMDQLVKWEEEINWKDGTPYNIEIKEINHDAGTFESEMVEIENGIDPVLDDIWWVFRKPQEGHRYILIADAAEGNEKSDFCAANVWDLSDPNNIEHVAYFHKRRIRPGAFSDLCSCLSIHYHCLYVPEVNNACGGIMSDRARNHPYIYLRNDEGRIDERETRKVGWFTSHSKKPAALDDAYKLLQKHGAKNRCPIANKTLVREMMSFEENIKEDKNGNRRPEWGARPGFHDDQVTCFSIMSYVNARQRDKLLKYPEKRVDNSYQHSVLEDAGNATKVPTRKVPSLSELRKKSQGRAYRKR
jgi:hypothetical protein